MAISKTILLFGDAASIEAARIHLENLPQIKRIDMVTSKKLRVFLHSELKESKWISELMHSNLHGFCFV